MIKLVCGFLLFVATFVTPRYLGDRELSDDKRSQARSLVDQIQNSRNRVFRREPQHDDDHGFATNEFDLFRKKYIDNKRIKLHKGMRTDDTFEDSLESDSFESSEEYKEKPVIVVVLNKNGTGEGVDLNNQDKVQDFVKKILAAKGINGHCNCAAKGIDDNYSDEDYSSEESSSEEDYDDSLELKTTKRIGKGYIQPKKQLLRCGCNRTRRTKRSNIVYYEESGKDSAVRMFLNDLQEVFLQRDGVKSKKGTPTSPSNAIILRCGGDRCGFLTGKHDDDTIENIMNHFELLVISDHENDQLL